MIKYNVNFLSVMLFSSLIVSIYQLPLIENCLNKYGYENNINEKIPFSKNFQQGIEDYKISLSSLLENKKEINLSKSGSITSNRIENNIDKNGISPTNSSKPDSLNSLTTSEKNKSCSEHCSVLMIGDSVMGDVDFSMQRMIQKQFPSWKVIDGHKVSSGLTNQTYYDWPATAKKLIENYKPDYVFVLLGTNDAQGMMSNGKALPFSKEAWFNEYSNRVNKIKNIIETNHASWYWIGLPVTKDKGFNSRLQVIRDIHFEQTKEHYISVEHIFGKNDHSEPINMKLRANDGIHLNSLGADLLAKELLIKLKV